MINFDQNKLIKLRSPPWSLRLRRDAKYNVYTICPRIYYKLVENSYKFNENVTLKIRNAYDKDEDSRLGTYYTVNPDLCKPQDVDTPKFIRILKSRYRTGSHNLMIEREVE